MIDWLACALVKLIGGLACRLPPAAVVRLGKGLGWLASWLAPKRTQIGVLNLRAAFDGRLTPSEARRMIRDCYQQLGAGMAELLRLPVMDQGYVDRYIRFDGEDRVLSAVATGRPLIFLTGHYGNWELPSIVGALKGYAVVAIARAQQQLPRLYRLLVSYRESKGCRIIHKGGAMRQLLVALEQRKLVGIVGDQASRQGVFVEFFGRPALFATGPFELAYRAHALILPLFLHRVRGPHHRLIVEPPITLDHRLPKPQAIHAGIETFVRTLSQHIREDPTQWLWMHRRWKHTPARRALVLSDGKLGHLKQSLAVVEALREHHPQLTHDVIEVRYRHRLARLAALCWSWWMPAGLGASRCLQWTLRRDTAEALLKRYADVIVSCGAATVPANVLWSAANRAKSIVIMNPAPLPLRRFHLVIAPSHDGLPRRANVVQTPGAIVHRMREEELQQARDRLLAHPRFRTTAMRQGSSEVARHPVVAVFIGGSTAHYDLSPAFAEALIRQVQAGCEAGHAWCVVTSSRRTSASVERVLDERLERDPRCRLALIATRDALDGTLEGMLGFADVAVVTGESISMVSEACASGRPVLVVEPPLRQVGGLALTKHQRFLRELVRDGYARAVNVPELSMAIQRVLRERPVAKRLDVFATVHDAVGRLL